MTVALEEILGLSPSERLWLIEQIWESLAAEPDALPLSDLQREELDRRIEAYERNPSDVLTWEEVRAQLDRPG